MIKMGIVTALFGLMAACATGEEVSTDPGASSETAQQGAADGTSSRPTPAVVQSLAWHLLLFHENCIDTFEQSCSASSPGPQCPAGTTDGSPCFNDGLICYQTVSSSLFNAYNCTN